MYCPVCCEYKGFMGSICEECDKIKKIVELYGNKQCLNVLETALLRDEKQIKKKLDFLGEIKEKVQKKL